MYFTKMELELLIWRKRLREAQAALASVRRHGGRTTRCAEDEVKYCLERLWLAQRQVDWAISEKASKKRITMMELV